MQPRHARTARRTGRYGAVALCLLSLAGCGADRPPASPSGEWAGMLMTEAGHCPDVTASRLVVDQSRVSFVPGSGVLVLTGPRLPDPDRLHAQLALVDMNRKPLPMVFEGRFAADHSRIDGVYGTPDCRARITLLRPASHPLQRALGN